MGFSQLFNTGWHAYLFIFMSHSFVFFIFQFISQKFSHKDFEVREFIKFITIIFSGVIFQFIFKLISIFILEEFVKYDYNYTNVFFITLQQAFKFWIAVATANFLHNLIRYIYTLRRANPNNFKSLHQMHRNHQTHYNNQKQMSILIFYTIRCMPLLHWHL